MCRSLGVSAVPTAPLTGVARRMAAQDRLVDCAGACMALHARYSKGTHGCSKSLSNSLRARAAARVRRSRHCSAVWGRPEYGLLVAWHYASGTHGGLKGYSWDSRAAHQSVMCSTRLGSGRVAQRRAARRTAARAGPCGIPPGGALTGWGTHGVLPSLHLFISSSLRDVLRARRASLSLHVLLSWARPTGRAECCTTRSCGAPRRTLQYSTGTHSVIHARRAPAQSRAHVAVPGARLLLSGRTMILAP